MMYPSFDGGLGFRGQTEELDEPPASPASDYTYPSVPEVNASRQFRSQPGSAEVPRTAGDDNAIENEPTLHVDYLSHEWKEEDIWTSWRYIVARRKVLSNSVRLENASWRTWTKTKDKLTTVSPEALNWLKDCDVTWLYGPLQTDTKKPFTSDSSAPRSQLSVSNSFLNKKPILKKKSASEAILQRSLSSHTLLQHAGAILKAQEAGLPRSRPSFGRATSDFGVGRFSRVSTSGTPTDESCVPGSAIPSSISSGLVSPSERRHIHFNDKVEQCIAVEGKDGYDDEEGGESYNAVEEGDEESDDGVVMMKQIPSKARLSNRSTPRSSFSNDSKTIAPLPSTTLKYRGDTPEPAEPPKSTGFWGAASRLTSSSSQETLRPQSPSTNYLLDDDEEASDLDPQWKIPEKESSSIHDTFTSPGHSSMSTSDDGYSPGPGLRRTPSGMFMPYDEDEEENAMNMGLFGRVVDTVNTARDIAHVIWNVGWRK